ncbi:hypothetical protein SAMN05192583_3250 [Sphingomonas gellani]|uniref:Sporulation related domain-containing protein n=1 Tax=Sphingomonas gellani TaxID=1166340 RepID=A0A1H8IAL4_9SPHN|nr:hypothetical protein [Sphingomonas gellani]SEN64868.1 hypothetical protein SAMN05192583_3250 [Sphingomonas gellani]
MATAPKTWVEWADFFSKTLIATAGLLVSAATLVLTYAEKQRAQAEQALATRRNAEIARKADARIDEASHRDKARFILDQLPPDLRERLNLQTAIDYCNDPSETGLRMGANAGLCRNVSKLGGERLAASASSATQVARTAVTQQDPKAFLNSPAAAAQNAGVAAAEAARPAASGRWFAVVGTLPQSAPGAVGALARQLNARLQGAGLPDNDVHVYRTRISNSFALTSGTDKSEEDARARARMLRRAGFSDAFAQPDRGWSRADDLR